MNKLTKQEEIKIENIIYEIRGVQVMLDSDLALLYRCKNGTKEVNQAVKNNIDKFPDRYSWILDEYDCNNLRSKILTANISNKSRVNPRVFTEQGIYMLATILKSKNATKMTLYIMDTFVAMRKYISNDLIEQKYINNMVVKHDEDIKLLQESFDKFQEKKKVNEIYYKGQIYDAYYAVLDIFNKSKKKLIIIDNYVDNTLLDIIKRLHVNVILITSKECYLTNQDISKYNEQYHNLEIYYDNTFHDRYFILDNKTYYHCGSSLNRLGYKTFSINELSDKDVKTSLSNTVKKIINEVI